MKCSRTFFGLTLALSLTACGDFIEFEADTIVLPDSAATRKTRFIVKDDANKREVETWYDLPPGGKWEIGKRTRRKPDGEEHEESTITFETEKKYPPGTPLVSDYQRRSKLSKQVSHNEPRLTIHNYFFVKTFNYEERFRDIVTPESLKKASRRFYDDVVERGADILAQESREGLTARQASMAIRATFDPLLEKFVNAIQDAVLARNKAPSNEELWRKLEPDQVAGQLIEVLPPPTGQDVDAWREAITNAYTKAVNTALDEKRFYEEEFLGAYGFRLFAPKYTFNVALSLPGALVESNAIRQDGSRLIWGFKRNDFFLKDHVLRARSRLVFPEWIAAAAALVVFFLITWFALRRRRRPQNPSPRQPHL